MKTEVVWKFKLEAKEVQKIVMPCDAKILCVQMQKIQNVDVLDHRNVFINEVPCIWAVCNPNNANKVRTFYVYGTGHEHNNFSKLTYIGTFQLNSGAFVFHVFENETEEEFER